MSDRSLETLGGRLAEQAGWLLLLLAHLAGRRVRQRVATEDLVQEVFLRAVIAAEHVPPADLGPPALRRFLTVLARRAVLDLARALRTARRDGREVRLVHADASASGVRADDLALSASGPATAAAMAEARSRTQRAFESLSPTYRRVIGLRQLQGLSAAETGRRMGRSAAAVHSLYRRALTAWSDAARADG